MDRMQFIRSVRRGDAGPGRPAGLRAGRRQLADQAHHHRRALPRGRRHRCLRATAVGRAHEADRPPGADRQQGRRRRHAGRRHRGASRARRLHLVHGRGAPCHRALHVPEARLQHRDRLRAGGAHLPRSAGDRGQPAQGRGQRPAVAAGVPPQEPRAAQLRLGRQRHLAPPRGRAVQAADQDLHHPHSLPRRRPRAAGSHRRPGGHDVRRAGLLGRAHQERAHQGDRGGERHARARLRQRADGRRRRRARRTRSRPGTACGHPRARPRRSSTRWPPN